jgi:hypothetical protein
MTFVKWEEMFAKDYLTIADMQDLLGMTYNDAAATIRDIKRSLKLSEKGVRLDVQGKLHVQDYFDYYRISNTERYCLRRMEAI